MIHDGDEIRGGIVKPSSNSKQRPPAPQGQGDRVATGVSNMEQKTLEQVKYEVLALLAEHGCWLRHPTCHELVIDCEKTKRTIHFMDISCHYGDDGKKLSKEEREAMSMAADKAMEFMREYEKTHPHPPPPAR